MGIRLCDVIADLTLRLHLPEIFEQKPSTPEVERSIDSFPVKAYTDLSHMGPDPTARP
jgi:hypothetical protein